MNVKFKNRDAKDSSISFNQINYILYNTLKCFMEITKHNNALSNFGTFSISFRYLAAQNPPSPSHSSASLVPQTV